MEEQQGVNVEAETTTTSPVENNEQETIVTEDVQKPVSNVQENLKIALQKERQRRQAAEEQLRQTQAQVYQAPDEDETVKRFLNVEATTLINNKILTDPSFKDRADLVQDEMKHTGKTIEDADNAVIARLFKEMTSVQDQEQIINKPPQQIKTTAIPEEKEKVDPDIQRELDMFDSMAESFGK